MHFYLQHGHLFWNPDWFYWSTKLTPHFLLDRGPWDRGLNSDLNFPSWIPIIFPNICSFASFAKGKCILAMAWALNLGNHPDSSSSLTCYSLVPSSNISMSLLECWNPPPTHQANNSDLTILFLPLCHEVCSPKKARTKLLNTGQILRLYRVQFCLSATAYHLNHCRSSLTMAVRITKEPAGLKNILLCTATNCMACIQIPITWYKISAFQSFDGNSKIQAAILRLNRSQCKAEDSGGT